jgi:ribosomal protein L37AE/L43A
MNGLNKKNEKSERNYSCKICDLYTSKLFDYNKHLSTRKHQNNVTLNQIKEKSTNLSQTHDCDNCGKKYKNRNGLWYHQKKCSKIVNETIHETPKQEQQNTLVLDPATVLELIRQNQEFKSLIIDQQNKLLELVGKPNTVNNNNNTMTNYNNNNNTFNLQFFLNETCKDAMNISEFIENLNIQLKELENVGNNGYVSGISDIILERIKGLEISKRPLHCTDAKRETMYIRDENEWNKDNDEKTKLKNFIEKVANQNIQKIPIWREENPECQDMHHEKYNYCMKLFRNSLGDIDEKQEKLYDKVIKNIAKQVTVDKNTITNE